MSRHSQCHMQVNESGEGRCSVLMWDGYGGDAGFCDEPAYGKRPESRVMRYRDGWTGELVETREDGRTPICITGLACPRHGGPAKKDAPP